jgi:hypothetical protein
MEHIESVARDLVERIRNGEIPDTAFAVVPAPCPKCGGVVQENYRKFQCRATFPLEVISVEWTRRWLSCFASGLSAR